MTLHVEEGEDTTMSPWHGLLAGVAVLQLIWGAVEFDAYYRSVGATGDWTGVWVFTGLGLSALLVQVRPGLGIPVALVQTLAAGYALCSLPLLLLWLWTPIGLLLPLIPSSVLLLMLRTVLAMALLCLLGAIGSWQVARQAGWQHR